MAEADADQLALGEQPALEAQLGLALRNLALTHDPIARLKATGEISAALRSTVKAWTDRMELEHARACRSAGKSWAEIGKALDISHQHAIRRFRHRI